MAQPNSRPPRPARWEQPSLKNQNHFHIPQPLFLQSIGARFDRLLVWSQNQLPDQGADLEQFLRGQVIFDGHSDWHPDRLLGQGGFGLVGSWVRRDHRGVVVDELALKQQKVRDKDEYVEPGPLRVFGLSNEAVIHTQMNASGHENFVHLRGYAFIPNLLRLPGARNQTGRSRSYMEFTPHMDLWTLMNRYRAWNRYFPEAFIWHVFDSLVAALQYMDSGMVYHYLQPNLPWYDNTVVVHLDLKPGNVLLGYSTPMKGIPTRLGGTHDSRLNYPIIKVTDFGLSEISGPWDNANPRIYWGRGTPGYKPSEQLHYGVQWSEPPNGRFRRVTATNNIIRDERRDQTPDFQFLTPANIWNVGKIIFDMATLSRPKMYQDSWTHMENVFNQWDRNAIREFQHSPWEISTNGRPRIRNPSSPELMDLVRACLKPSINERINLQDLRDRTVSGLQMIEDEVLADGHDDYRQPFFSVKRRKLYYVGNEINNMPPAAQKFDFTDKDYHRLVSTRFTNPDWEDLNPPAAIWDQFKQAEPVLIQHSNYVIRNGRLVFGPEPGIATVPLQAPAPTRARTSTPSPSSGTGPTGQRDSLGSRGDDSGNNNPPDNGGGGGVNGVISGTNNTPGIIWDIDDIVTPSPGRGVISAPDGHITDIDNISTSATGRFGRGGTTVPGATTLGIDDIVTPSNRNIGRSVENTQPQGPITAIDPTNDMSSTNGFLSKRSSTRSDVSNDQTRTILINGGDRDRNGNVHRNYHFNNDGASDIDIDIDLSDSDINVEFDIQSDDELNLSFLDDLPPNIQIYINGVRVEGNLNAARITRRSSGSNRSDQSQRRRTDGVSSSSPDGSDAPSTPDENRHFPPASVPGSKSDASSSSMSPPLLSPSLPTLPLSNLTTAMNRSQPAQQQPTNTSADNFIASSSVDPVIDSLRGGRTRTPEPSSPPVHTIPSLGSNSRTQAVIRPQQMTRPPYRSSSNTLEKSTSSEQNTRKRKRSVLGSAWESELEDRARGEREE